jgi:hypothetical protein
LSNSLCARRIDTFIRNNYTADTNVMFVSVLRQLSDAYTYFNDTARAAAAGGMADTITAAVNAHLYAGDHYITQLNPNGTVRDFVDYDSNLLAVGLGVASDDRVPAILKRVDGGKCTHARPTYGAPGLQRCGHWGTDTPSGHSVGAVLRQGELLRRQYG